MILSLKTILILLLLAFLAGLVLFTPNRDKMTELTEEQCASSNERLVISLECWQICCQFLQ